MKCHSPETLAALKSLATAASARARIPRPLAAAAMIALAIAGAARAAEPGFAEGTRLIDKYRCQQCHSLDKPGAGPSFRDVAKRYASDPNALSELQTTIRNGSTGAWGPTPMAGVDVPDKDLKHLVAFILSLKEY